jgi:hypothetical protein
MMEKKPKSQELDEIYADIEAGLESGGDDRFWECAEHLLGEMHKNRRILELAGDVERKRRPPYGLLDPLDRLKQRIHDMVLEVADLPEAEQVDVLKSFLDEIESRLGPSTIETLMRMASPRLEE